jgi:hypothetical protein
MGWSVRSIAIIVSLTLTLGCAQVKEVTKKVFPGKEEKPAKDSKAPEAKTKAKDTPQAEDNQDPSKKPATESGTKPEGIFGPK